MGKAAEPTAHELRLRIRRGEHVRHTAGLAVGRVQGNVAILPAAWADDFLRFCVQNPKPCPILVVGDAGRPELPALGRDIDIRRDLPRYRVFRDGVEVATPTDIVDHWRDDLVTFVLGCSLSFEWALMEAGMRLKHVETDSTVPMYGSSIDCAPVGPFGGKMVVSMRPFRPAEAIRAIQITSRFPTMHGAPVHIGLPEALGIRDLGRPDFGDPVDVGADELPLFWGCGVTPQVAIEQAKPPLFISHYPGCMLITDLANAALAAL